MIATKKSILGDEEVVEEEEEAEAPLPKKKLKSRNPGGLLHLGTGNETENRNPNLNANRKKAVGEEAAAAENPRQSETETDSNGRETEETETETEEEIGIARGEVPLENETEEIEVLRGIEKGEVRLEIEIEEVLREVEEVSIVTGMISEEGLTGMVVVEEEKEDVTEARHQLPIGEPRRIWERGGTKEGLLREIGTTEGEMTLGMIVVLLLEGMIIGIGLEEEEEGMMIGILGEIGMIGGMIVVAVEEMIEVRCFIF